MSEKAKLAADYAGRYSQGHLESYLRPYHRLESEILAADILSIDIKRINEIFRNVSVNVSDTKDTILEPLEVMVSYEQEREYLDRLRRTGLSFIKGGGFAAVTMAGGQGTRLGHNGPKGTYVLPVKNPRSLFQIQCEGLLKVSGEAGKQIPWFIMTSLENHDATVKYFKDNSFFGYDNGNVRFFPQNEIPVVDMQGRLLVCGGRIVRAADGNGGIFAALSSSGNITVMEELGIKKVFVCGIDNALINMADPVFLGYALEKGKQITSKSVLKRSFDEKAGVFCRKNGRPAYIEYTEMPEDKARLTGSDGSFVFGDAGIVAYVYDIALLRQLAGKPLPYHPAYKKVPYDLPDGTPAEVREPNAVKFESFIFDSFEYAEDVAVMRADRRKEFAPIKNRTGEDSPESLLSGDPVMKM